MMLRSEPGSARPVVSMTTLLNLGISPRSAFLKRSRREFTNDDCSVQQMHPEESSTTELSTCCTSS